MRNRDIQALSDEEYQVWRARQIKIIYRLQAIGAILSLLSIALSLHAADYLF